MDSKQEWGFKTSHLTLVLRHTVKTQPRKPPDTLWGISRERETVPSTFTPSNTVVTVGPWVSSLVRLESRWKSISLLCHPYSFFHNSTPSFQGSKSIFSPYLKSPDNVSYHWYQISSNNR